MSEPNVTSSCVYSRKLAVLSRGISASRDETISRHRHRDDCSLIAFRVQQDYWDPTHVSMLCC